MLKDKGRQLKEEQELGCQILSNKTNIIIDICFTINTHTIKKTNHFKERLRKILTGTHRLLYEKFSDGREMYPKHIKFTYKFM